MKRSNTITILVIAAVAASVGLADHAVAQYRADSCDGIAASPKVRQMMEDKRTPAVPNEDVVVQNGSDVYVPAPTGRIEPAPQSPPPPPPETVPPPPPGAPPVVETYGTYQPTYGYVDAEACAPVGYQATGPDGIAASPKVRKQIDEQHPALVVLPQPVVIIQQ